MSNVFRLLSQTQQDVINTMKEKGCLKRWPGGFWTYENVEIERRSWDKFIGHYKIPKWHCRVRTLRSLHDKGLVVLDEVNKICQLLST